MSGEHASALAQLADIHAAAEPSAWPPAPGWWLLAALGLAVLVLLARAGLRGLAAARRRRDWMRELDRLAAAHDPVRDPQGHLAALNRLFRAVALQAFPAEGCARLEGDEWVAFVAGRLPRPLDPAPLVALARGPYEPQPQYDPAALRALAAAWVKSHA